MPLNAKQKQFVKEYLIDKNASRAAAAAGYSKKTAGSMGHELLKKPEIRKSVNEALEKQADRTGLTAERVLKEISRLAFVDISKAFDKDHNLIPLKEMDEDTRRAISGVETDELYRGKGNDKKKIGYTRKIKMSDKTRALEMLAKHFKLLTDITQHQGTDGGPIVMLTMPSNDSEAKDDSGSDSSKA